MYQCPNCGNNITPGAKFCAACAFDLSQPYPTVPVRGGVQTARACQRCGTAVAPNAQFCPVCSSPLGVAGGYGIGPYGTGSRAPNRTPLIIGAVALSVILIAGIVVLVVLLSRSGDQTTSGGSTNTNTSRGNQNAGPTKENAVQKLKDFLAAVEAGDRDKAISMVVLPPNLDAEKAKQELKDANSVDLSSTGINILAQKGTWGKAKDVYPNQTRLNDITNKSGLPADAFYALTYRDSYVLYYWDGSKFKLVDLKDVDKLDSSS